MQIEGTHLYVLRAVLFLIQLVAVICCGALLFRNNPNKSIRTLALPWPKEIAIAICACLAAWAPLWTAWWKISLFPTRLTEDYRSGLPQNFEDTLTSLFFDSGRPSYLYYAMLGIVSEIPGFRVIHLHLTFLVLTGVFIYLFFRALGAVSTPWLGVLLVVATPGGVQLIEGNPWSAQLSIFASCRSYGTEMVFVSLATVLMAPVFVRSSAWSLAGAVCCLGMAAADNPFHLVHLVGFGLGVLGYFWLENRAAGASEPLQKWQWLIMVCGVVACLAVVGPALFSLGADDGHARTEWSKWIFSLSDSKVIIPYLLMLGLAWWRPPREWYPLIGIALMTSIVMLFLPLIISHRTLQSTYRYTWPTLPTVVVADFGLLWFYFGRLGRRLIDASRQDIEHLMGQGTTMVVIAVYIAFVQEWFRGVELLAVRQIVELESSEALYRRFANGDEEGPPVHLDINTHHSMTEFRSLVPRARVDLGDEPIIDTWPGRWEQSIFQCDGTEEVRYVGIGYDFDEHGKPTMGCSRCSPESLWDREGDPFMLYSTRLGRQVFVYSDEMGSPYYPFTVWTCAAG